MASKKKKGPWDDRLYNYRARLHPHPPRHPMGIKDADTFYLFIDKGHDDYSVWLVRLGIINAYELKDKPRGPAAKRYAENWFTNHRHGISGITGFPFLVRSTKKGSFGRFLGIVECSKGHFLHTELLEQGHAVMYRRR